MVYLVLLNTKIVPTLNYIQYVYVPCAIQSWNKKTSYNQIIRSCIYKMLPNGSSKRNMSTRLKIYKGSQHPHKAQCPIYIDNIKNI